MELPSCPLPRWMLPLLALGLGTVLPLAGAEHLTSPDGAVVVDVDLQDRQPVWSVAFAGKPVLIPGRLGLETGTAAGAGYTLVRSERAANDSSWKPLWGPVSSVRDNYRELTLTLEPAGSPGKSGLQIILRAYDEGVACRYRVLGGPGQDQAVIRKRLTEYRFAGDHRIFQNRDYAYGTARISGMKRSEGAVTIELGDGRFAALTDADRSDFPSVAWQRKQDQPNTLVGGFPDATPATGPAPFTTSWEVLLLGRDLAELHHRRVLIPTLNPPCAIADPSWIRPGKAITQVYNAKMTNQELKPLMEFASRNGIEYVEIDHSWSGAETKWTAEEIAQFDAKKGAFWNSHPEWRDNVKGGLTAAAKGYVPFRPNSYGGGNLVDLDLPALAAYGNSLTPKVGLFLYVRCALLKEFGGEHPIDEVFRTYESWGIAGVKPGFVPCGTQAHERTIAYMVKNAAEHHLHAVIHDALTPYGLSRTWPNLLNVEGVAGEEGEPGIAPEVKSLHDVMIPFTRGLMGPLDYTPQFYKKSKTQCHQVAMIGIYDGRPSIRAGMKAWSPGGDGGSELEFIRRYPALCDEERTFAETGRYVAVARRKGATWFLAAMAGPAAVQTAISLEFLAPDRKYSATGHRDAPGTRKAEPFTRAVDRTAPWDLTMSADGGQVVIFEPQP